MTFLLYFIFHLLLCFLFRRAFRLYCKTNNKRNDTNHANDSFDFADILIVVVVDVISTFRNANFTLFLPKHHKGNQCYQEYETR